MLFLFLFLGVAWTSIWGWFAISTLPALKKAIVEGPPPAAIVPIVIFSICILIGVIIIIVSLKAILSNRNVEQKGSLEYGRVLDVRYGGAVINYNTPLYEARILLNPNNSPKVLVTNIGPDKHAYEKGTYVVVKYYKNRINIVETAPYYADGLSDFKNWAEQYIEQRRAEKVTEEFKMDIPPHGDLIDEELNFFNEKMKEYVKAGLRFFVFLWMPFCALVSYFVFRAVPTGEVGIVPAIIIAGFDLLGIVMLIQTVRIAIFIDEKHFEFIRGSVIEKKEIILKNAKAYVSIDVKLNNGRVLEKILMPYQGWRTAEDVVIAVNKKMRAYFIFNARENRFSAFSEKSARLALKI